MTVVSPPWRCRERQLYVHSVVARQRCLLWKSQYQQAIQKCVHSRYEGVVVEIEIHAQGVRHTSGGVLPMKRSVDQVLTIFKEAECRSGRQ